MLVIHESYDIWTPSFSDIGSPTFGLIDTALELRYGEENESGENLLKGSVFSLEQKSCGELARGEGKVTEYRSATIHIYSVSLAGHMVRHGNANEVCGW